MDITAEEYLEEQTKWFEDIQEELIEPRHAKIAIAMAQSEMKDKAIEALSSVLGNWVHGGDADCIIAEFEERLDKQRNINVLHKTKEKKR